MSAAEQYEVGDAYEAPGSTVDGPASFDVATLSHQPAAPLVRTRRGREPERYPVDALYPYDPRLPEAMQQDLDKLRCQPDRELAQRLYEFWQAIYPSWKSGEAAKWREQEAQDKDTADLERLVALGDRAFKGEFGDEAKEAAVTILLAPGYKPQKRTDLPSLREFESVLWKLRGRR